MANFSSFFYDDCSLQKDTSMKVVYIAIQTHLRELPELVCYPNGFIGQYSNTGKPGCRRRSDSEVRESRG